MTITFNQWNPQVFILRKKNASTDLPNFIFYREIKNKFFSLLLYLIIFIEWFLIHKQKKKMIKGKKLYRSYLIARDFQDWELL